VVMTDPDSDSAMQNGDSKIERVASHYNIDGIGAELEERWTADANESSTRQLAKYFNKSVVRAALRGAGATPLESELKAIYEALSADATDTAELIEVRERLSEHGIDAESLSGDFVSHQTVYNYLTKSRGAVYESTTSSAERLRKANESVQRVKNRMVAIASRNIDTLRRADILSLGEHDVVGEVHIYCHDCGQRYGMRDLIENRGCNCGSDS